MTPKLPDIHSQSSVDSSPEEVSVGHQAQSSDELGSVVSLPTSTLNRELNNSDTSESSTADDKVSEEPRDVEKTTESSTSKQPSKLAAEPPAKKEQEEQKQSEDATEPEPSETPKHSGGIPALDYSTFDNRRRLLGLFPSYWLLKGYRPLPFGITMVLWGALSFFAIVVSGWVSVPLPPFQWVAKTAEVALINGDYPLAGFAGQPVWVGFQVVLAVVVGAFMGPRWATVLYTAYVIGGLLGMPWFANGGGAGYIFEPSFGYILGIWMTAICAGIAFNLALPPKIPRTQKAIKLRQRAERLRLQRQRNGRHRLLSRCAAVVSVVVRLMQPHPKKTMGWLGWVSRTLAMTLLCVALTHALGLAWCTVLDVVQLLPAGAAEQMKADLTYHVWPYDALITCAVMLWVLPLKAILNPIYR